MRLLVLESETVTGEDLSLAERLSFCEATFQKRPADDALLPHVIGSAEGLLCSKVPVTAELLEACPSLRYVGLMATGTNNVDLAACAARGVAVTNVPDYSSHAVAQLTVAFLLQFATRASDYFRSTAQGDWLRAEQFCYYPFPMTELCQKTLGLYGLGAIGSQVARIASALGMRVIYHARRRRDCEYEFVTAEELFRQSDFLSLHCPLTAETAHLIRRETLALMRRGAYLVNTARGGLVDEVALAEALREGRLAGFGGDVLEKEPQREDCPLIGAPNVYLTPHVAWAPRETRERLLGVLVSNLQVYLSGGEQNRCEK